MSQRKGLELRIRPGQTVTLRDGTELTNLNLRFNTRLRIVTRDHAAFSDTGLGPSREVNTKGEV